LRYTKLGTDLSVRDNNNNIIIYYYYEVARWQVIPANSAVFRNHLITVIPRDHMLPRVNFKKNYNKRICIAP